MKLTSRQLQCLEGFWRRKTAKEIGRQLGITHYAVEKHLLAVRQQLGVTSSAAAAALVFGGPQGTTVEPYYGGAELPQGRESSEIESALDGGRSAAGAAIDQPPPINTLGAGMTLLAILAVAVGSILSLAALVGAAQGANQLWKTFGQ
ncbi:LuxR C-terminal-related transcriptional regulator [Sphingomonas ginkgonis]|uniref:LuxR C-terminal-related transcriptional regulator n=1 Tax=Sphingomonas ginkgonis TaxID=2315330 RepID=UPI0016394F68|nr:LuxR C-terminal-related transcriptional regulator [Sphingomonas ginkgonis]